MKRTLVRLVAVTTTALVALTGVAHASDLKSDLNTATSPMDRNKDLGTVVGGNTYTFQTGVYYTGGHDSATFAVNAKPSFVTTVTGGTIQDPGSEDAVNSTVTVVAPCVLGAFGQNNTSNTLITGSAVTYKVTSSVGSGGWAETDAFVNIKGNVTSIGSSCTVVDPCAGRSAPVAPSVTVSPATPTGLNTWYKAGSDASFTVSPPASAEYSVDGGTTWTPYSSAVALADGVHSVQARNFLPATTTPACARVDGTASAAQEVKVDTVAPSVSLHGELLDSNSYYEGEVPAAPTCTTEVDATSGVNGVCLVGDYGSSVGDHTVSASATDYAGNVGTASFSYVVDDDTTPPEIEADLEPDDPDGLEGWYIADVSLTWDVFEGETPSSVTIPVGECLDQNITEDQGETPYTCSATSRGGPADPVTVRIKRDGTLPTVSLNADGPADGETYWEGEVDAPTCNASDPGTSASGLNGECSVHDFSDEPGTHTVYATATDRAGNVGESSAITYTVLNDWTAPVITKVVTPATPNGSDGWYTSDVTIDWTVTEPETPSSLVPSGCEYVSITADQLLTNYTCSASSLGGSAGPVTVSVKRDATAPNASASASPAPNANGWNNSDVTVSFSTTDAGLSGLDSCSDDVVVSADTPVAGQDVSGTCTDLAGNESDEASVTVKLDRTDPTVARVGGPIAKTYYIGLDTLPAEPTCSIDDSLSGADLGSCVVNGFSTAVGTHEVSVTGSDRAENDATSSSVTYTIANLTTGGFYQPVDMDKVNMVKGGSTVPLKFKVFAGSTEVTSTTIVDTFKAYKKDCITNTFLGTDEIEQYTSGATVLRYDSTGGQFIQNWQTPKGAWICYHVVLTLDGGVTIEANFKSK